MDTTPSISVIIPSHNAAKFLPDAIGSLIEQKMPELEIILIDDNSSDNTSTLVSKWGKKVRYVHSKCGSPAAARNTGLRYSKTEFVSFLDADDIWTPDHLRAQLAFHASHQELDFSHGYTKKILLASSLSSRPHIPRDDAAHLNPNPGSILFRRDALVKLGGFDETLHFGEDIDLWLRIRAAGFKGAVFEKVVLLYRMHADNMTNSQTADHHDLLNVLYKSIIRQGKRPKFTPLSARLSHFSDKNRDFPLVSAIVICSTGLPIHETLRSIAEQGYPALELILVIDKSPDKKLQENLQIFRHLQGSTIIENDAHGYANAVNLGLRAANGEFITCTQAGDVWSQDRLRNQAGVLLFNPEAGLILGGTRLVIDPKNQSTNVITRYSIPPWDALGSALIRKEALKLVGELDESFQDGASTEWLARFSSGSASMIYPMIIRISRVVHYQRSENCSCFNMESFSQSNFIQILHKAIKRRREQTR